MTNRILIIACAILAFMLFVQGIIILGEQILSAIAMIVGALLLTRMFNYLRFNVHDMFTQKQVLMMRERFQEEIRQNHFRNIRWICASSLIGISLILESATYLGKSQNSTFVMTAGGIVLITISLYLWVNRKKIFTPEQLRMMMGTLSEEINTTGVKMLRLAEKAGKEGKVI